MIVILGILEGVKYHRETDVWVTSLGNAWIDQSINQSIKDFIIVSKVASQGEIPLY